MADLTRITDVVTRAAAGIDSAVVLIRELAKEIRDTAPTQQALDALAAQLEAKAGELAAAVTENPDPTP